MIDLASKTPDDTRDLAAQLAGLAVAGDVVLLCGDLGAGKTVFVQGFGRALGVDEVITSPTFTLVRTYAGRLRLVHVDVYRLDLTEEIADLGLAELIDDEAVAVVEWGDKAEPVLPADFLEVRITFTDSDDGRRFRLRAVGRSWSARQASMRRALERWVVTDPGPRPGRGTGDDGEVVG